MIIIIGLGNPGEEYRHTRHNIGFEVVDQLAENLQTVFTQESKKTLEVAKSNFLSNRIFLLKPLSYMNKSGEPVRAYLDYYKLQPDAVYLIHDDMDLELGRLKIQINGGAGGHHGVESVYQHLPAYKQVIVRFRLGIGKPQVAGQSSEFASMDQMRAAAQGGSKFCALRASKDWVLSKFTQVEQQVALLQVKRTVESVLHSVEHTPQSAMNLFNR